MAAILIRRNGYALRQPRLARRRSAGAVALRARRRGPGRSCATGAPIRFRVAGDVSAVTCVRVRVAAARRRPTGGPRAQRWHRSASRADPATSPARPSWRGARTSRCCWAASSARSPAGPPRPAGRACCGSAPASRPTCSGSASGRARLSGAAAARRDPTTPKAEPGAVASFTVNPPGPGFKAGQTLTFDGCRLARPRRQDHAYAWSDGDPPHPVANGVTLTPLVRRARHLQDHAQRQRRRRRHDLLRARRSTSAGRARGAAQPRQLAGQDRLPGPGRARARASSRSRPVLRRRPGRRARRTRARTRRSTRP